MQSGVMYQKIIIQLLRRLTEENVFVFHESEWLLFNFNFNFILFFTKTVHKFRYIKDLKLVVIKYYLYNLYETSSVNVIKREFGGV